MKNSTVFIPFSATLGHVCDYSDQTMKILSRDNFVVGIALASPFSPWKNIVGFFKQEFLITLSSTLKILKPIMFFPFQRIEWVKRFNIFLNILFLNIFFTSSRKKVLWFFEPRYTSLFIHFLKYDISVYDCVDYFLENRKTEKEHVFLLKKTQKVFVNSEVLKKKYFPFRKDISVVKLGFSKDQMPLLEIKQKHLKQKTFFFLGSIDWRIDFNFVEKLINNRKKDSFIFIGPQDFKLNNEKEKKLHKQFQTLINRKKISWIPALPRKEAIKKVSDFDVGVIPYNLSFPFNVFCYPMKVMEYFYLGIPVISTSIQELKRFPDHIYIPEEKGWSGVASFLESESFLKQKKRRQIALENSWDKKIHSIMRVLDA